MLIQALWAQPPSSWPSHICKETPLLYSWPGKDSEYISSDIYIQSLSELLSPPIFLPRRISCSLLMKYPTTSCLVFLFLSPPLPSQQSTSGFHKHIHVITKKWRGEKRVEHWKRRGKGVYISREAWTSRSGNIDSQDITVFHHCSKVFTHVFLTWARFSLVRD